MVRQIAPWVVSTAVILQMLLVGAVLWKYWDAVRVYIQRDDGLSNLSLGDKKSERRAVPQNDEIEGFEMEVLPGVPQIPTLTF